MRLAISPPKQRPHYPTALKAHPCSGEYAFVICQIQVVRALAVVGTLSLLGGTAVADEARQLRVEAAKLVYAAENAGSGAARHALLKEAHGKLLKLRERYPSAAVQLEVYIGGKRTKLLPDDLLREAGVVDLPDRDVGTLRPKGKHTNRSADNALGKDHAVNLTNLGDKNIQAVLGRDPSPSAVDENGWTDLHYAAALNSVDLAKALMNAGADTAARLKDDGRPLSDRLKQSLNALGVAPNAYRRHGYQPLHVAVFHNAGEAVTFLVDSGADINAKDKNGRTPLDTARRRDPFGKVTWLLISRGAE